MANTPQAEGQQVPIRELHQRELSDEEVDTYEPPKCAKGVYKSKAVDLIEDDEDIPGPLKAPPDA